MTSFPAERVGLTNVGRIAEGLRADLVIFDPDTIADNTTLQQPDAPPTGIQAVLIGGHIVVQDGRVVDHERHGQVLRR
jgi:N-acyl-D-aspartate/D-glutamate deacylase